MTPEEEEQIERAEMEKAIQNLGEHWDTVHIFVTRVLDNGSTRFRDRGTGNWFARTGHIRHWVVGQDEEARIDQRKLREETE